MTLWLLSVIIVASMLCGYLVSIRPPRQPVVPAPTAPLTEIPRATDTPQAGTPTLTPSATPSPAP